MDNRGRLLAFHDPKTLQEQCNSNRWELIWGEEDALDLGAVRRWVEHPHHDSASAGLLLEAWNFFEDLSHSLKASPPLPTQGAIHDNAYEKIFGGNALAADGGEETWTDEETAAACELLRAGLDLWEQATSRSDPS
ncbi:hypothetical protein [Streptomyces sp. NPDC048473]|uniref:hypothetical protein n=1 Tax=unclassified Streptomyces TaxID=2593676 RepID=UPI003720DC14